MTRQTKKNGTPFSFLEGMKNGTLSNKMTSNHFDIQNVLKWNIMMPSIVKGYGIIIANGLSFLPLNLIYKNGSSEQSLAVGCSSSDCRN